MSFDIFVVGTASLDRLHLAAGVTDAAGGAGLYTALAAQRAGARTGLFGPRPEPLPSMLQQAAALLPWLGPTISVAEMPQLEIAHYGGGKADLLAASWGAETSWWPDSLPVALHEAKIIHVAALSSAERQLDFLLALQEHAPEALFSVGTYGRVAHRQTERVRQLLNLADIFFMNENEAMAIFGQVETAQPAPEALLFVTLGEHGARVVTAEGATTVPAVVTSEVDPTGAGDTFCGAALAALVAGATPVEAAQAGVALAAQTVSVVGTAALLS